MPSRISGPLTCLAIIIFAFATVPGCYKNQIGHSQQPNESKSQSTSEIKSNQESNSDEYRAAELFIGDLERKLPTTSNPTRAFDEQLNQIREELDQISSRFPRSDVAFASDAYLLKLRPTYDQFFRAFERLESGFPESDALLEAIRMVKLQRQLPRIENCYASVVANPACSIEARAAAAMERLHFHDNMARLWQQSDSDAGRELLRNANSLEDFEYIKSHGQRDQKDRLAEMESIVASFGEVALEEGRKIKSILQPSIYEFKNLAIGMKAPEISGVDFNGNPLSTSSYFGKTILLVFWGDW